MTGIVLTFEQGVQDVHEQVQKTRKMLDHPDSQRALRQAKASARAVAEECLRDMEKGLAEDLGDRDFIVGKIAYYRGALSVL